MNLPKRKIYTRKDGVVAPLTQLKMQSEEIQRWAFELRERCVIEDARGEIKARTGISLGTDSSYSEFCKWYRHGLELENEMNAADEALELCETLGDKVDAQKLREATSWVLMNRALQNRNDPLALRLLVESRKRDEFGLMTRKLLHQLSRDSDTKGLE